jgi:predicted HTH transcriptional regulator
LLAKGLVCINLKTFKTIVAFLNSDGGTLLIGVEDDGRIYGLENDFSLLGQKRSPIDLFEQELTSLICDALANLSLNISPSVLKKLKANKFVRLW